MPDRLLLDDPVLLPVQAFFNAVGDSSFLGMVDALTNRVGYSINDVHVRFSMEVGAKGEFFDAVSFSLFEDEVIIAVSDLKEYLAKVSGDFALEHPEQRPALSRLLERL